MNARNASGASRTLAVGILTVAVLGAATTGFVAGRATVAVRAELAQAAGQTVSTSDLAGFRAAEHQGSAENPDAAVPSAPDNIRFLATEHQGSAENPNAAITVPCAGPGCWEK